MTDEQLSALLRLKRFEQPPPGYYDRLLQDVHRRQRCELLRRPLWRIALDRVQTFLGEPSTGQLSYAGAMAVVAVAGLSIGGFLLPAKTAPDVSGPAFAEARSAPLPDEPPAPATLSAPVNLLTLANEPEAASTAPDRAPFRAPRGRSAGSRQPRYVIDAQPASYEATTVSFNF